MSKLSEAADRLARKKVVHDNKGDEWNRRLDALDQLEPAAFAMGDAAITEREVDLAGMENTIRTLSNLPFAASPSVQSSSAPPPAVHHDTGDPVK